MTNLIMRRPGMRRRRHIHDWPSMFNMEDSPFGMMKHAEDCGTCDSWSPRVDIVEKENSWEFKAELPDIKAEDIDVTFKEGILSRKKLPTVHSPGSRDSLEVLKDDSAFQAESRKKISRRITRTAY